MRVTAVAALAITLAASSLASAEGWDEPMRVRPRHHYDHETQSGLAMGYVWTKFDNTTIPGNWNLTGQLVRASAYATVRRHMYVAAEIDVGSLSGTGAMSTAGVPNGAVARTDASMPPEMTSSLGTTSGKLVQAKAVAGMRADLLGPITGALELAGGVRVVDIGDTRFTSSTSSQIDGIVEARGRVDVWVGRSWTVGGVAGVNILQRDNVTVGVMLGVHLPR